MANSEIDTMYENPGLDAELLSELGSLIRKHGLDDGHGGRALDAVVALRWEYADSTGTNRLIIATPEHPALSVDLFLHGARAFSEDDET